MILYPNDPLAPRRIDPHFADEAVAASARGLSVAVVDHDVIMTASGDALRSAVGTVPRGADGRPTGAVYRGWMIPTPRYDALAGALAERGVVLLTTPELYQRAHELPGWYAALVAWTPRSVWTVGTGAPELEAARREVGPGPLVIRDYVKSMKHDWDEAAFVPASDDGVPLRRVAARFVELRGEDLAGGLVLRDFEDLVGPEARTWWVDGSCVLVAAHPDTPGAVPDGVDVAEIASAVRSLGVRFVTVDVVRRADGAWRVMELGDGQVSDRPSSVSPERFAATVLCPVSDAADAAASAASSHPVGRHDA